MSDDKEVVSCPHCKKDDTKCKTCNGFGFVYKIIQIIYKPIKN